LHTSHQDKKVHPSVRLNDGFYLLYDPITSESAVFLIHLCSLLWDFTREISF